MNPTARHLIIWVAIAAFARVSRITATRESRWNGARLRKPMSMRNGARFLPALCSSPFARSRVRRIPSAQSCRAHRRSPDRRSPRAECLPGDRSPQAVGFAKGLFQGHFVADWVMPYPRIPAAQQIELDETLRELRQFLDEHLDPAEIDRQADIPREVIDGLGCVGVLGMTAPKEYGGRGFSQMANCKVLEEIGRRCASTSVFVNAHHSIGIRALLLFGTHEQKQQWLPKLVTGEQLGAFALTEREAGSDAANVQMQARPSEDGSHFILNGEKRYITNAAIAHELTVMARTPVPGSDRTAVTAFLVTPDMPGFEMLEARMPKTGIKGTATGRFALRDVKVPKENVLGPIGKGLKVALTVLDFGRTTFGACCTGAAKTCLELAVAHANTRRQFNKTLGEFELGKKKIARTAAY